MGRGARYRGLLTPVRPRSGDSAAPRGQRRGKSGKPGITADEEGLSCPSPTAAPQPHGRARATSAHLARDGRIPRDCGLRGSAA